MSKQTDDLNELSRRLFGEIENATAGILEANDDGPGLWALARAFLANGGATLIEAIQLAPDITGAEKRILATSTLLVELLAVLYGHASFIDEEWPGEPVLPLGYVIDSILKANELLDPVVKAMRADATAKSH